MTESDLITAWRQHLAAVRRRATSRRRELIRSDLHRQDRAGLTARGRQYQPKPTKPTLSNLVLVERYEDQAGKWNLSFTLQDRKFDEVFLRLTDDVHARSPMRRNEHVALDRVSIVFEEWRRLLQPAATGLSRWRNSVDSSENCGCLLGRVQQARARSTRP